jgi:type VI protein secretion system component Hcp
MVQRAGVGEQYPLAFDTLISGADSAGFLDEVTLSYAKIQWEYQPVSPTGAPVPVVKGGWDLKLNKRI